jgi:hypothetical protein
MCATSSCANSSFDLAKSEGRIWQHRAQSAAHGQLPLLPVCPVATVLRGLTGIALVRQKGEAKDSPWTPGPVRAGYRARQRWSSR